MGEKSSYLKRIFINVAYVIVAFALVKSIGVIGAIIFFVSHAFISEKFGFFISTLLSLIIGVCSSLLLIYFIDEKINSPFSNYEKIIQNEKADHNEKADNIEAIISNEVANNLPMDRAYQGEVQLPDFAGRDRDFSIYRTRIKEEMLTGPNFAGHYAIVEIGCGTSCRSVFVGDVSNGKVFEFPYGGDDYQSLSLEYDVKSRYVYATWHDAENCFSDFIEWNGRTFISSGKRVMGCNPPRN